MHFKVVTQNLFPKGINTINQPVLKYFSLNHAFRTKNLQNLLDRLFHTNLVVLGTKHDSIMQNIDVILMLTLQAKSSMKYEIQ